MTTMTYDDVTEEIHSSTNEVFSTMIPMEIKAEGSFYQKENMISTDILSLVSFTGEHSGILALFCCKKIALKITSNMLGIEVSEIDQDVKDAMGEVTNMIVGNVKNKVFETYGAMHLSVPIVIAGAGLSISSASKNKEIEPIELTGSVTCNSQNTWLMTPFSSEGDVFHIGFVMKKNE